MLFLRFSTRLQNNYNSQHHQNMYVGLHADKNETVHGIATISVSVESYYAITDFRTLNKTVDDAIRNAVKSEAFEKALVDEESCEPQQERLRKN